ncbi:hypothetical protein JCM10908_003369 [Rhodotorula pacifica]|uniref:M28 family metallopeptidase n=1 Tax=Rhodotorula pacifica TaxID=1495444 RepID=UPI00317D289D
MKIGPTSTAITALVAFLSHVDAAPSTRPAHLSSQAQLLLVQRSDGSIGDTTTVPDCAVHQGAVGSSQVTDLYLVTSPCHAVLSGLRSDRHKSILYDVESVPGREEQHSQVGPLFWLRPDNLDLEDEDFPQQPSSQVVLSSAPTSTDSIKDLLASLDTALAPSHVVDLPSANRDSNSQEEEGALVSLSRSNATHRLAQLEYLTSHPLLAHYTLVSVPLSSASTENNIYPDVPDFAVRRIQHHLDTLTFQPTLSAVIKSLEGEKAEDRIRRDVQVLSGEDQGALKEEEKWVSRHSMSQGGHRASNWVHAQMSSYGFNCTQLSYLTGFAPMVECVYRDSGLAEQASDGSNVTMRANETVVLGAHFDSRGSFGYPTAPGADDDASGTSLVLAVARQIWQHRLQFSRKLVLALFSGEEQGLLSSSYYASQLRSSNEDVLMMLQVDMVGYRKPGEPMQLARPDLIGLKEAGWFVGNVSGIYAPELVVGYTPACCSDHQSYVAQGYPATWIFERNGAIADPCYHNSCDLSRREGYSFEQIAAHTKVAFATVWELAGGRLP